MNALTAHPEEKEGIQLAVPGLGERLRAARMACNLDIGKLAARIHLTADVVDALERDDYSEMPARVFVRGYVRNYARAVNLPSESVLAQFDRLWPEEDHPVSVSDSPRLASDPHPRRRWPLVVGWLVVAVFVGLTLVWWQGHLDRYFGTGGGAAAPEVAAPSAPEPRDGESPPPAPTTASEPSVPLAEEASTPPPAGETPTPSAAPEPQVLTEVRPLPEPIPQGSGPEAGEAADVAEQEARPDAGAASAAPSADETQRGASGRQAAPPGVRIRFLEDTWVDIRDSARRFKLVGIQKRGTEQVLGGEPPYTLVIGNARGVRLSVNGEPYDLTPHVQRNVARLRLSPGG